MRLLCVYLFLQTVSAQISFRGYFGTSRVCDQWTCLNGKFNFTDVLPRKDEYRDFIRGRLPIEWHNTGDSAVEACYQAKETEKYTNTCTGQALMHCVVDKMIQNCPPVFRNQEDGCARVASIPGNSYMFSQSRFVNLRSIRSSPERRHAELFINICCQLPQMFDEAVLNECGFTEVLRYINRETINKSWPFRNGPSIQDVVPQTTDRTVVGQVYNFHLLPESTTSTPWHEYITNAGDQDDGNEVQDPIECCRKIDDFIAPDWRSKCGFKLRWDPQHRLSNPNYTADASRNTTKQCEDLSPAMSCVLNRMGLLNRWGFIDHFRMKDRIRAYSNGTSSYLYAVFNSVYQSAPMYGDQCDSPRKLFNLLDAMLIVCEPDMRQTTPQCNKMFAEVTNTLPDNAKQKIDGLLNSQRIVSYRVGFLPAKVVLDHPSLYFPRPTKRFQEIPRSRVQENRRYDFGVLGLLSQPPKVTTIDLKPRNRTLVLLPVYQRTPNNDSLALNSLHDDGVFRG